MENFIKIKKNTYVDSLESLAESSVLNEQPGVEVGYAGMATKAFLDILAEIGLLTEEAAACGPNDFVIAARAESAEVFEAAVAAATVSQTSVSDGGAPAGESYSSIRAAVKAHPEARSQCPASMRWPRSRRR